MWEFNIEFVPKDLGDLWDNRLSQRADLWEDRWVYENRRNDCV